MIIPSLGICLEIHSFLLEFRLHMLPQLHCASNRIGKVIGLWRESIIVIIKWRMVMIHDSPLTLLPVCREEQDGLRLRVRLFNILKLFVEESVFLLVDERHGSTAVSDEDRGHLREFRE